MPFLPDGTFERLRSWVADRTAGIKIKSDLHDAHDDDIALALSQVWQRDGGSVPTAHMPMGGKRLTGLGAAIDPNDAVRKQQLDDALSPGTSNIGDYLTTLRDPGSNWLRRDGATVLQTSYPALFALIGQSYGRIAGFSTLGTITGAAAWHDIVYASGKLVAVGSGGKISYSTNNGVSWTAATTGVTDELFGICYGGGQFVAAGANGRILTSPDGVTWTSQTSGTAEVIWQVEYANGIYLAVANAVSNVAAFTSSDGMAWAPRTIATPWTATLKGVAFGNGVWVAVGVGGAIAVSRDNGATWAASNGGTAIDLRWVAFGRGRFVAVGNKVITTSASGNAWTSQGTSNDLQAVTFGQGGFVAVGFSYSVSSTDGLSWVANTPLASHFFTGVSYGADAFYAVEANGKGGKSSWSFNTVTEFQLPDGGSAIDYIKVL